jgi:hypothetical protein
MNVISRIRIGRRMHLMPVLAAFVCLQLVTPCVSADDAMKRQLSPTAPSGAAHPGAERPAGAPVAEKARACDYLTLAPPADASVGNAPTSCSIAVAELPAANLEELAWQAALMDSSAFGQLRILRTPEVTALDEATKRKHIRETCSAK